MSLTLGASRPRVGLFHHGVPQAFDPEGKGYIEGSFLKNLLQTRGDAFRDDEADAMVAAAMDAESGRIYYEDFAELLANDGRRSLDGSA